MGHYLSEMQDDDYWERKRKDKEERIKELTLRIQSAIDSKGIAAVLADIISAQDPVYFNKRYFY